MDSNLQIRSDLSTNSATTTAPCLSQPMCIIFVPVRDFDSGKCFVYHAQLLLRRSCSNVKGRISFAAAAYTFCSKRLSFSKYFCGVHTTTPTQPVPQKPPSPHHHEQKEKMKSASGSNRTISAFSESCGLTMLKRKQREDIHSKEDRNDREIVPTQEEQKQ